MIELAKPCLDVGMYVRNIDASRRFYEDDVGLPYEELLPVGGGVHQHRLGLRGSVLKLNASRNDLAAEPTGYRRLLIAADVAARRDLVDPDGTAVSLVPEGEDGITAIGIEIAAARADVPRFESVLTAGVGGLTVGTTVLRVVPVDPPPERAGPLSGAGFRYLTVQVRDVTSEHARMVEAGYEGAMPPRKLGEVAAISFVRDPGGNWLEISQRASLTGDLPDSL